MAKSKIYLFSVMYLHFRKFAEKYHFTFDLLKTFFYSLLLICGFLVMRKFVPIQLHAIIFGFVAIIIIFVMCILEDYRDAKQEEEEDQKRRKLFGL